MKFLIVDDEHELYKNMFADCFKTNAYNIEEIPRMNIPPILQGLYKLHFSDKLNRRVWIPGKMLWKECYYLHKYKFDENEKYYIIFMNGSLRYHFDNDYLNDLKQKFPNIKLVMILYDSFSNPAAKRSISMIPVFDYVFSFDKFDCIKHKLIHIYSTFSKPEFIKKDESKKTSCFFIGYGVGRLSILQDVFRNISANVKGCKFYIAGVKKVDQKDIDGVIYNEKMTYEEELQMAFNTDCIVEVLKDGQSGITLRTCEAIAFNKKLLTNNQSLSKMPFYDERYMKIFRDYKDIDFEFINEKINVHYEDNDYFSPLKILDHLAVIDKDL